MKLEQPINPNYAATVVRVRNIEPLPNSDNLVGIQMFGMQAVYRKDILKVGDFVLLFPTECQLSDEYASYNNMYRHGDLNADKTVTGYLEDNRRIRAIKLRGNRSDCLIMPLSSLAYITGNINDFPEGAVFDTVDGKEICRKYVIPAKANTSQPKQKKARMVDPKLFPEHYDTEHYLRNLDMLTATVPNDTHVIITQKLHGTLLRVGRVPVTRKLSWLEKLGKKLGIKVQETEYGPVYGSNHTIKDVEDPHQNHYYQAVGGVDLYTYWGRQFADLIPKGFIVYGELIGFELTGKPIQTGYTYNVPDGTAHWYVYRVAYINEDGQMADLSWDQVLEFCKDKGLRHVAEMCRVPLWAATEQFVQTLMDVDYTTAPMWKHCDTVPLCKESPCDEGIVVRIDGIRPKVYKAKSPLFLQKETALLDKGDAGVEE